MLKYKFELFIKGCNQVFKKGMKPGCICSSEVDFKTANEEDIFDPSFIKALTDTEDKIIKDNIRVEIKRI